MELKLQLVDTAGGGRRVLTACLGSVSSPGTLLHVSEGSFCFGFFFFFFENAVRKSDQSRKLQSNENSSQKFTLTPAFVLPNSKDADPSAGMLSS